MQGFVFKRRSLLSLLTLVMFVLSACGGPKAPLTGTLTDAYTQQPIAGATVKVGEATTTTDASGSWTIADWTNEATLEISAADYEGVTKPLSDTEPVGATPVTLTLELRPNTVSGLVLDSYSQQPVAGALVNASSGISATTDASGAYKLTDIPEQVEITISAADYAPVTESLDRQTSFDTTLRPSVLSGVITDKYSGQPLSGITVSAGDVSAETDAEGRYVLENVEPDSELLISSTDHATQTLTVPAATSLDVVLTPSTVRGKVLDAETGAPLEKGAVIAMPALEGSDPTKPYTGTAVALTRLNADGTYELTGVPEGSQIQVLAPGYKKAWTTLSDGEFAADLEAEPFVAKAIYITAATASSKSALTELFDFVDRTEINAVVIDVKLDIAGDVGGVGFISKHPLIIDAGTSSDYLDMNWIVQEARDRDIYLIARMAVMRDNRLADAKPEWAAQSVNGGVWEDDGGLKWLDPFNENVREYNVGLAEEIASYGFDEIQFDYIRFPSDGRTSNLVFSEPIDPENNPEKMYQAIGDVLRDAHGRINGAGAFFSIDVFGYATWRNMWEIGQSLEVMADHTDYVCAMVYPSHYAYGELGLGNPDEHPYEIVKDSIEKGRERMEGKYALQRPWLQAFTATWLSPVTRYGRTEVQAQIQAVNEVEGTSGWILWNAANYYEEDWVN